MLGTLPVVTPTPLDRLSITWQRIFSHLDMIRALRQVYQHLAGHKAYAFLLQLFLQGFLLFAHLGQFRAQALYLGFFFYGFSFLWG